jgi:hypothetical protein
VVSGDEGGGAGPGAQTLAGCVTMVGQFARILYPEGPGLARVDVGLREGGVRGHEARLAGLGWQEAGDRSWLAAAAGQVSGTAFVLLRFQDGRPGQALVS